MLHRFAFTNFQSFRQRTELDLRLNGKVPPIPWTANDQGERVSLLSAVIGPNASGKTTLLKPLVFAQWFLSHSFHLSPSAEIGIRPHFAAEGEPTELELEASDGAGRHWRYELSFEPQRVLREALFLRKPDTRQFGYVFLRQWDAQAGEYQVKQQGFGLKPSEAKKARANTSLISTAAQYGVPLAQDLARVSLLSNIAAVGRLEFDAMKDLPMAAEHFALNPAQRVRMAQLLKAWDLGLSDVELRELSHQQGDGKVEKFWFPYGLHADSKGGTHILPFLDESSGTQSAFVLLSRLLPVLANGGIAVIDEFENDLHPLMLEAILDLFAHPETNPHRAQLLFTCHAMEVLNLLHKSQVVLVEKDQACESSAWRLDEVRGIRTDDNFYAKYMAGAYGGVPQL